MAYIKHRSTSWKAPHFIHFEKGKVWYTIFTIVMLVIVAGALYFKQWLLAGVIAAAILAVYSFARQKPAERQYRIGADGIQVGRKHYRYEDLKSFWVASTPETNILYIQSKSRFAPPEMINIGDNDPARVRSILRQHLPEEPRSELLSDRINRWLKF